MNQLVDGDGVQAAFADAVEYALGKFVRRGQALRLDEFPRLVVEADEVGERPADVDGDDDHRRSRSGRGVKMREGVGREAVTARQTIQFPAERNAPPAGPGSGAQSFLLKASWTKSSSIR